MPLIGERSASLVMSLNVSRYFKTRFCLFTNTTSIEHLILRHNNGGENTIDMGWGTASLLQV